MTNISMNHYNGDEVRKNWKVGMQVEFLPKDVVHGEPIKGVIVGHIYVNVLVIETETHVWHVSTFRCQPI